MSELSFACFASRSPPRESGLRQQVSVLKRRHPRPRLAVLDRLFWLLVRRFWSQWKQALLVVTPETVVRWHRAGFRWYWALISKVRKPIGRTPISKEARDLIFQMVAENPSWGAPRIHGELLIEKCRATGQKLVGGDEDAGGTKDQSTSQAKCSQTSNSATSRHYYTDRETAREPSD